MYRVIFLEDAINEIEYAADWYRKQQYGLDNQFKDNVLNSINKLQSDTLVHGISYRGTSHVTVRKFPYAIYFRKDIDLKIITIFGVLHIKQNKAKLDKRL